MTLWVSNPPPIYPRHRKSDTFEGSELQVALGGEVGPASAKANGRIRRCAFAKVLGVAGVADYLP
jgi:hypothetical protein